MRKGIGSIINEYNQLCEEDQTVATFNAMFPTCSLSGFQSDLRVSIGDYNKGRRTVSIGSNIELEHVFSLIDHSTQRYECNKFLLRQPNGDLIGMFFNFKEACEFLDVIPNALKAKIEQGYYIYEGLNHE